MFSALPTWPPPHTVLAPMSDPSPVILPRISTGRVIPLTLDGNPGPAPVGARVHAVADRPLWVPQRGSLSLTGGTVA